LLFRVLLSRQTGSRPIAPKSASERSFSFRCMISNDASLPIGVCLQSAHSLTQLVCSVNPNPLHYSITPSQSLSTFVPILRTIKLPSLIESLTILLYDIITYRLQSTTIIIIIIIIIWQFILSTCPMRYRRYRVFLLGRYLLFKCRVTILSILLIIYIVGTTD